jgi:rRNA processing protein Gar1
MGKHADRKVEEAVGMQTRYGKFLSDAKSAYKAVKGKWPVTVCGYELYEDEFNDRIADAIDRVELAKKDEKDNKAISRKVTIRKGVLKTKKRELVSLRSKLVQQAEQVKMNAALAEIGKLNDVLGTIKDMMIEIDEDPTKLSIDDLTAEDPNAARNKKVNSFLND